MRSFLVEALVVLGAFGSGVARADDPLAGEWAGGFSLGADSFTVIGHVERGPDGFKGNWIVLPEGQFALEEIRLEGDRVRLRVARPLGALAVDASLAAGVIEGDVRSGERGGRLELRRFVPLPADRLERYAGAYELAAGERVYLQPWSEMMDLTQLTYLDTRGRFRYLLPASESALFSGPGLVKFVPAEVSVRFHEEGGIASGLVWEEGGLTRTARRLDLYGSDDVTFQSGDVSLAGRLLLPKGRGRHPAVVFAHGSGPQDQASGLPFVHFLVERGIAILGYDKRGVGGSGGDWKQSGFETLADDLLAGVRFLKGRPEIDPKRIGILGVSQGGWLGPLAASRSKGVAFVVSVSGPGVSPAEQENDRIGNAAREAGLPASDVEQLLALRRMVDDYLRGKTTWEALKAALEAKKEAPWSRTGSGS